MSSYYVRTYHGEKWHATDEERELPARAACGVIVANNPRRTVDTLRAQDQEFPESVCRLCRPWIGGKSRFEDHT